MNKKRCFAVLSSAAMGLVMACGITTSAYAKVTSYIIQDNDKVISFNLDDLLIDYANSLSGEEAPMFDEYVKHAAQLVAFDDTVKGLVSYDSVVAVYADALGEGKGNEFNIDAVTENAKAEDIKNITVGYEWKDGAIVEANQQTVKATIEQAGTAIMGKTVVIASLPDDVDATKYAVTIDGNALTYDSSTKKFKITLEGTFTKEELQSKVLANLISDEFDVSDIY